MDRRVKDVGFDLQGDEETMKQMLEKSQDVLPHCVDSNERRSDPFPLLTLY